MVSVSQWEREAIGERTRDAMAHKRANVERVGATPRGHRPSADGLHVELEPLEQEGGALADFPLAWSAAVSALFRLKTNGETAEQMNDDLFPLVARTICTNSLSNSSVRLTQRARLHSSSIGRFFQRARSVSIVEGNQARSCRLGRACFGPSRPGQCVGPYPRFGRWAPFGIDRRLAKAAFRVFAWRPGAGAGLAVV